MFFTILDFKEMESQGYMAAFPSILVSIWSLNWIHTYCLFKCIFLLRSFDARQRYFPLCSTDIFPKIGLGEPRRPHQISFFGPDLNEAFKKTPNNMFLWFLHRYIRILSGWLHLKGYEASNPSCGPFCLRLFWGRGDWRGLPNGRSPAPPPVLWRCGRGLRPSMATSKDRNF